MDETAARLGRAMYARLVELIAMLAVVLLGAGAWLMPGEDWTPVRVSRASNPATNCSAIVKQPGAEAPATGVTTMALFFDNDNGNTINGSDDADLMFGNGGADTMAGNGGDDFMDGGAGADVLNGGAGTDTASYANSSFGVTVNLATGQGGGDELISIENVRGSEFSDRLTGHAGANLLQGFGNNDTLDGGAGNDTLNGGAEEDVIFGGQGADDLIGGDGYDTASYRYSSGGVTVSLLTGTGAGGDAAGDELSSLEALIGSELDDVLTGNLGANKLHGLGGSDLIEGGAGKDSLYGGSGEDQLAGGGGSDQLWGGNGIDTASYQGVYDGVVVDLALGKGYGGEAAGDELSGIENVSGTDFADVLFGSAEANVLSGQTGNDGLNGGAGSDTLSGSFGEDTLQGGEGGDVLDGGAGNDWASYSQSAAGVTVSLATGLGTAGDAAGDSLVSVEDLIGSSQADALAGNGVANVITGLSGGDTVGAGGGSDTVYGGSGDDSLNGGGSADRLMGDSGADTINGGNGADVLTGGADRDVMNGGNGDDSFDFNALIESGISGATRDSIAGFVHLADTIDVASIDAIAGGGDNAFSFIGTAAFSGEGQIRAVQSGANTIVELNTSGANGEEMAITLTNFIAATLTADDFVL